MRAHRPSHPVGGRSIEVVSGFEDLVYEPRPLLVVPDSRGRVRNWIHALAQPWYGAIVVLTSQATPRDYLEYLNRRGITHLTAGEDQVDLAAALLSRPSKLSVGDLLDECVQIVAKNVCMGGARSQ